MEKDDDDGADEEEDDGGVEREGGRNTNIEGEKEEIWWLERGRWEGETPTVTLAILGS